MVARSRRNRSRMPGRDSAGFRGGLRVVAAAARAASAFTVIGLLLPSCGGDGGSAPDPVQSVQVTSPIEDVMAVGRSVQLDATAENASGTALSGRNFTWRSSDETVASVDGDGVVEGLAAGSATIRAEADGVSGSLRMEVVAAELGTIAALLDDPYTEGLASGLGDAVEEPIRTARADCEAALDEGHVLDLGDCLDVIREESASDPTDRALLAVLSLIAERADLLRGL